METQTEADPIIVTLALQDGFERDLVVVHVGGEEVLREQTVTTDVRIGLAQSFETAVTGFPIAVEIALPNRNLTGALVLETARSRHIGVSIQDGDIRFRVSERPFGYI